MFFAVSRQEVLFLEHVSPRDLQRKRHFAIECIPIPRAAAAQADGAPTSNVCGRCPVRILMGGFSCGWAGYFKKALLESDEEWSQHKKLYTTKGSVRGVVPPGFAYFDVAFGLQEGFAAEIAGYCNRSCAVLVFLLSRLSRCSTER